MASRAELPPNPGLPHAGRAAAAQGGADDALVGSVTSLATATAVGETTFAASSVSMTMSSHGRVTITRGEASGSATALSPDGTAFAVAETSILPGGADLVRITSSTASGSGLLDGQAWMSESSATRFFILDIAGHAGPPVPVVREREVTSALDAPPPVPGGNTAAFDAAILVSGELTLVDVRIEALAVEDALSLSNLQATGTASDWMLVG